MSNTVTTPVPTTVLWISGHTGHVNSTPLGSQTAADHYAAALRSWGHDVTDILPTSEASLVELVRVSEELGLYDTDALQEQITNDIYDESRFTPEVRAILDQTVPPYQAPEPIAIDDHDVSQRLAVRERYESVKAIAILRKAAAHAGLKGAWKGPKRDELIAYLVQAETETGTDYLEAIK